MSNEVKKLRKQHKITQKELATSIGVSRLTITYVETGKYNPTLKLAYKIAKYFNKSIEEIFNLASI